MYVSELCSQNAWVPDFSPLKFDSKKASSELGKSCIQKYKISMIMQRIEGYFLVWLKRNKLIVYFYLFYIFTYNV
jgi:hypothetical protein